MDNAPAPAAGNPGQPVALRPAITHPPTAAPRVAVESDDAARIKHQDRLLRIDEVERLTGIKRSSLYAKIKTGNFPCAVRITARSVAWPLSRVQAWIQDRIAEADLQQGSIK